ncbi:MAG: hypothetical protein LUG89_01485 [Methanosphaera sp.]|nr:hypothetical protein [Methanosphaera sp.]
MDLDSSIEKTITEVQKLMNTNSIIGDPISTPDKTIIPISKAALGFGVGVGKTKQDDVNPFGGVGGGGSIDPVAFLVIYHNIPGPDGVDILLVDNQGTTVEELLNTVGSLVWDLLSNRDESGEDESIEDQSTVDKVITKIKPSDDDEKE